MLTEARSRRCRRPEDGSNERGRSRFPSQHAAEMVPGAAVHDVNQGFRPLHDMSGRARARGCARFADRAGTLLMGRSARRRGCGRLGRGHSRGRGRRGRPIARGLCYLKGAFHDVPCVVAQDRVGVAGRTGASTQVASFCRSAARSIPTTVGSDHRLNESGSTPTPLNASGASWFPARTGPRHRPRRAPSPSADLPWSHCRRCPRSRRVLRCLRCRPDRPFRPCRPYRRP
jgi:hypothetical protein